jgi:hypothetical protein
MFVKLGRPLSLKKLKRAFCVPVVPISACTSLADIGPDDLMVMFIYPY